VGKLWRVRQKKAITLLTWDTYVKELTTKKNRQMFTITFNTKTPEEFKEAIQGLSALFQEDKPKKSKVEPKTEVKAVAQPAPVTTAATPPETPAPVAPSGITLEVVRAAVQEKATAKDENKAAIKSILTSFGAPNVATLSPENYTEFLTKVKEIA
jgi:hypothetical protein